MKRDIRVLTYNLWLKTTPLGIKAAKAVDERIDALGEFLGPMLAANRFDAIVLNEAFKYNEIIASLRRHCVALQHTTPIDQWRICFVWSDGDAYDVEITDYH